MAIRGLIRDLLDHAPGGHEHAAEIGMGTHPDAGREHLLHALVHNGIDLRASSPEEADMLLKGMESTLDSLRTIPGGLADHLPGGAMAEASWKFLTTGELRGDLRGGATMDWHGFFGELIVRLTGHGSGDHTAPAVHFGEVHPMAPDGVAGLEQGSSSYGGSYDPDDFHVSADHTYYPSTSDYVGGVGGYEEVNPPE